MQVTLSFSTNQTPGVAGCGAAVVVTGAMVLVVGSGVGFTVVVFGSSVDVVIGLVVGERVVVAAVVVVGATVGVVVLGETVVVSVVFGAAVVVSVVLGGTVVLSVVLGESVDGLIVVVVSPGTGGNSGLTGLDSGVTSLKLAKLIAGKRKKLTGLIE